MRTGSRNTAGRSATFCLAVLWISACNSAEITSEPGLSRALDGAWRMVSAETIVPDGTRLPGSSHESLLLISDGYYSLNWAYGADASEYYVARFNPTDAEKLDRYGRLLVNAGSFELSADLLTIHPVFALVPEYVGGLGEFEYSLDAGILELIWRTIESADGIPDPNTALGVRYVSRWERIPGQ